MSKKIKISIIVPCYNISEYVPKTVESIKKNFSDKFDIEPIIINDASTDNTLEVIRNNIDNRFVLVNNEENIGLSLTREEGIKKATGDFIYFLDGDDTLSEQFNDAMLKVSNMSEFKFIKFGINKEKYNRKYNFRRGLQVSHFILGRQFMIENNLTQVPGILFEDTHFMAKIESALKSKDIKYIHCIKELPFVYTWLREGSIMNSKHDKVEIQKSLKAMSQLQIDEKIKNTYFFSLWFSFLYNLKSNKISKEEQTSDIKRMLKEYIKLIQFWKLPILFKIRYIVYKLTRKGMF